MSRIKGMTGDVAALRDALECATASLVRIEFTERITRLRMEQAKRRYGLDELIDPALDELAVIVKAAQSAKGEIAKAMQKVTGC